MRLGTRTGLTAIAVVAGCGLLATVIGMSGPLKEPAASTATGESVATPSQTQAPDHLTFPTPRESTAPPSSPRPRPTLVSDDRLLPNLRSLPPEDVAIRIAGGQRQLWFTSIIANAGYGPVEVTPDALWPCPPGQRHASQVLYRDSARDARFDRAVDTKVTTRKGGCMLDHPGHGHWHFDAVARYSLTRPVDTSHIVGSDKVSFCLRDNRETPSVSPVKVPEHYGECTPDTVQGISPGWADVYDTDLPDQHLVLPTDLPDGSYCLHNEADPLGLLLETDETDNAAVIVVRITGDSVAVGPAGRCG
jgi:hypothetical protein